MIKCLLLCSITFVIFITYCKYEYTFIIKIFSFSYLLIFHRIRDMKTRTVPKLTDIDIHSTTRQPHGASTQLPPIDPGYSERFLQRS